MWKVVFGAALVCIISCAGTTLVVAGDQSSLNTAQAQCKAIAGEDFSGVQDAPTQVTNAALMEATHGVPTYCQIQGYIDPQVGFELRLPVENWNGKFVEAGCSGSCGSIEVEHCDGPLGRGYACITSDMGHKGTGEDELWADHNLQASIDFGYRATHVTALAGRAIAQRYYQAPVERSYFVGCSTGGYQGLTEAQRFPWDFDGIIAGAPEIDESSSYLRVTWIARVALDQQGKPVLTRDDLQLVHRAAVARCDRDDGVQDGVIGNPFNCNFDPKELICKGSRTSGCLNESKAKVVSKLYAGATTSSGELIYQQGFPRGSELLWGLLWPTSGIEQYFKYGIPGYTTAPTWKYTDFDFDSDYKRFGLAAYYDNSNPDLRKFKRAGGKLIVYQGGNDTINLAGPVIDYYETVEKTIGGRVPTQEFFRLFIVPGMNHCTGGDGAYAIDYLHYLEAWVEREQAPDALIGAHVGDDYLLAQPNTNEEWGQTPEGKLWVAASNLKIPLDPAIPIAFSRPVYPYPLMTRYVGHGSPDSARNFSPTKPQVAGE
jgi:feruloyl esterase